jgi:putative transposase
LNKELWSGEFWTDGYYFATVGERGDWDTVEKYVQNHGKPNAQLKQLKMFD